MKKIYPLALLVCTLFVINSRSIAQSWTSKVDNDRHHFYVVGKGGLNSFLYKADGKNAKLKIGGSLGLHYDYYFLKFMGIGTGVEFSFFRASYDMNDKNYQMEAVDNDPMSGSGSQPFIFGVEIKNASVSQSASYMYIPLMLRFRFHHFYMGVGAKAGIFLGGNYYRNMGQLKTYGIYKNLYEPIENVPEHGFISEPAVGNNGIWKLKTDWALSFDFGVKLHIKPNTRKPNTSQSDTQKKWNQTVYFGIYADYGLNNLNKARASSLSSEYPVVYNSDVNECLEYNPPINISSSTLYIHSLSVGVKMAIGLNLK